MDRIGLSIPAWLVVTAIAACGNEDGPDSATSRASDEESSATTATTDTGEVPDCMGIADMAVCEAEPACVWSLDFGPACVVNCELIEDEATCEGLEECFWFQDACEFELLK